MSAPDPGSADPLSLHGVVPPTVTAFDDDGGLDAETTAAHARFVVDRGVHGVFPLGTNGEFALLGPEERDEVVHAVVDEVGEEVPVIAGVGEPATRRTVERARAAERAGVDGVVAVTPYYYPLDGDAAVEHYRTVCAAVDCPVYVYHIPSKTGNDLSLETLDELAEIDNLAGLKDSSKDVPWLGQAVAAHDDLTFLAGSDSLLKPGLDLGCTGMVSAVANAFPELVVDLYEAYNDGDRERAVELQERVYAVRSAIKRGPYMAGVKEALSHRGFDAGPLRSPLRRMDDDDSEALRTELAELGLLE
ncbi:MULTISPECIES: dihydrodipicolinate synthase family protein [Halolamina]|uniref:4-hydroxy-tetrahydrodipicolinate synthase/2-dehydro-3-deoxy-phosphogluconate/2-dehydro-3-deoxy-6-phosphogalactonate aldolase n=1 Tax=Halolamina pelagica TaxID=699431 RepID=A0A1I5R0R9_9EURY|nr:MULTISPECIES: dihydrodipicolinate synthase family protein [Halolamina]NHX35624.1 dihydrodipicolinate synthase family protein [Halolamina sp. R1-12]SFP51921.1 4-hydroxy-tetrahydrodipicolinate synthase/2-dehydro-3-deoxy-phosphogluconate/2-dehydro-3-deoxy-6-phosphogalactonate aldolase [Halolamina pelagica]